MRVILLIILSMPFQRSVAQNSPESVTSLLSGKQKKEWVASPWRHVMGTDAKKVCKGGESYTFFKDSTVEIKKCVDGLIIKNHFRWRVIKEAQENVLYLGDEKYQIRVKQGRKSEVKLRSLVHTKQAISHEVILKYETY